MQLEFTFTVSFVTGSELLHFAKSCRWTVIKKKPHLCGSVRQSMWAEWSVNNFPSMLWAFNNDSALLLAHWYQKHHV